MENGLCYKYVVNMWITSYVFICPFLNFCFHLFDGSLYGNLFLVHGFNGELSTWSVAVNVLVICIYFSPGVLLVLLGYCIKTSAKKLELFAKTVATLFIFSTILRSFCYVIFFQVIGNEIGITWKDITWEAIMLLSIDSVTAVAMMVVGVSWLIWRRREKGHTRKLWIGTNKVVKVKAKKRDVTMFKYQKRFTPYSVPIKYGDTRLLSGTNSEPARDFSHGIKSLVNDLWEPSKVGIGKDAVSLKHSRISIYKIDYIGTGETLNVYKEWKQQITASVATYIEMGSLHGLVEYGNTRDIATRLKCPQLDASVDDRLNECYLFHGTLVEHVTGIATEGFRLPTMARMLGKGIYFTDSPVKADQYTGKGDSGVMILARVVLGNVAITNTTKVNVHDVDTKNRRSVRNPICCFTREALPNHSLVYDGGLFREYVVYDSCQAFPEFAIYYTRENVVTV